MTDVSAATNQDLRSAEPGPSLWRNRDFLLLVSGQTISYAGDGVQNFAMPFLVLALTGSAAQAGLVLGLNTASLLLVSLLAGALVDRWDRKRTMLLCDTGRMLAVASIPIAVWAGNLTMLQIYIVVVVAGILSTFFTLANSASLPNVVGQEHLPAAIARSQTALSIVRLFGSPLGGLLYTIGQCVPFVANAVSFGVSVVSLRWIRAEFQQERQHRSRNLKADITEAFVWLWRRPLLRYLMFVNGADNLRYAGGYLVIILIAQNLGTPSVGIGVIFTAAGVGALLGNLAAEHVRRRFTFGRITLTMLWVEALLFPLYAFAPNAVAMAVIAATESFVVPI
jgi:MFS family permease